MISFLSKAVVMSAKSQASDSNSNSFAQYQTSFTSGKDNHVIVISEMPILPENDTPSKTHLLINSKPENKVSYLSFSEQCKEKGPITYKTKPEPELIIESVLEHFSYLKFRNSFRGSI